MDMRLILPENEPKLVKVRATLSDRRENPHTLRPCWSRLV